jgi:cellulose synthase/poly-beta-1,6-N-acetylglucosamine synthase-like glycosyltransferase
MARHPVVVTTDADCVHDPEWLVQTASWFTDPKVQMVVGAVRLHPVVGLWQEMERAEFSVLQATGCATLGYRIPTLCNGANLAFRKEAFDRVMGYEGYEHLAGGDDQVLMKKVGSVWPGGIRFNAQPHTVASTPPQHQIIEFLRQRIRWAAKWRYQSSWAVTLALLIAAGNAGFLFIQIQTVLAPTPAGVGLLSVKLILEWVLLARIGRFLSQPFPAVAFLLWQLLYPAYAVTMGLLVQILPFAWKGRQYFR